MAWSLWGAEPASKENAHGLVMPDEEEERVVCDEEACHGPGTAKHHDSRSGGSRLSSLLVDLHESLVDDIRQHQVVAGTHACCRRERRQNVFACLFY